MHRTNPVTYPAYGLLFLGLLLGSVAAGEQKPADEPAPAPRAQVDQGQGASLLIVPIGGNKSVQMKGKQLIRTVVNQRDDVASVQPDPSDPRSVIVTGKQAGTTRITLTAADDAKTTEVFEVTVQLDVEFLRILLQRTAPTANIQIVPAGSQGALATVILSGTVNHAEDINPIMKVAESIVGLGRVVNSLRVVSVQQVQLDVVIAQVSRSQLRRMSFDFLSTGQHHWVNSSPGGAVLTSSFTQSPGQPLTFTNIFGQPNGAPPNFFGAIFNDQQQFFGFLQLLRNENVAKLLAEPRLVTVSGKIANFVSGGQQAVPSPGGLGAVSVQFVPFGTQLTFLPIVLGNGRIWLEVTPSVSALDAAAGVTVSGFTVQGRRLQSLSTTVELEDGQTFVLGGLIQHTVNGATTKVPVLGDMPFIGAAFSAKSYQEEESEVVVVVTPHLVDPQDCAQAPKVLPGQETRSPDDFELFLEGILEAPRGPRHVNHDRRYVPAYKNGPSASVFPCAGQGPAPGCGAGCGSGCNGSGLADGGAISYPGETPVTATAGTLPEAARNAQILPPVDLGDAGTRPAAPADAKTAGPSVFGPAGLEK